MLRSRLNSLIGACAALLLGAHCGAAPIAWRTQWSDAVFVQAEKDRRFVILDLHAVWCHWCHVMDEKTYGDPKVQSLISKHYVAVSVDADSDPDLSSRYGDWGWPATIVLAADGSEIVKRRGYIPPEQMASLLQAIVDDPTPGPSVGPALAMTQGGSTHLNRRARGSLIRTYEQAYDEQYGGWGRVHKFIDAASLELSYSRIDEGDPSAGRQARQTLDANLRLIDPVWGGVYQYSDEADWSSPHFEKLLSYQADDLRMYAEAYARWQDPRYLAAATSLYRYLTTFLAAPDGGFYVSQDADVSAQISGHDFYPQDDKARRAIGMPRIDTHEYARETGWAIRALCKYYEVTGENDALLKAETAARWAIANRSLPGGAFRHDAQDRGGPFLEDALAMSQAYLALYRSTGDREWLRRAGTVLRSVDAALRDPNAGFIAAPRSNRHHGVFRDAVRQPEQNAAVVRVASLMHRYTGNVRYQSMARHGMKYLAAYAQAAPEQLQAEILLADRELTAAPIHITVVGHKTDPAAIELHLAALKYPSDYLQIDWWDRDEGPLPNPEIQYPPLDRAAAFACSASACSMPVYDPAALAPAVRSALASN
ncbi:MAG TPA: DUF255 domain-containing protein [Steroidobacteraceae bacterium]|jgi:uncharacterized protein YyaL (SSP411 family)|nr:DUF255 domain-containing protein [Steroidobacteraceae bacterium]